MNSENEKLRGLLQQALDMLEEQALHIEAEVQPAGNKLLNQIRAALSQQAEPQRNGWISVEDLLPEARNGTRYLVARDCGNGTLKSISVGFLLDGEWHISDGSRSFRDMGYRVTHWLPLPSPPTP